MTLRRQIPRPTDNVGTGIIGLTEGVGTEGRHFYLCPQCGQAVDARDLGIAPRNWRA